MKKNTSLNTRNSPKVRCGAVKPISGRFLLREVSTSARFIVFYFGTDADVYGFICASRLLSDACYSTTGSSARYLSSEQPQTVCISSRLFPFNFHMRLTELSSWIQCDHNLFLRGHISFYFLFLKIFSTDQLLFLSLSLVFNSVNWVAFGSWMDRLWWELNPNFLWREWSSESLLLDYVESW